MEIRAEDLYFLEGMPERTLSSLDEGGSFRKKSHIARSGASSETSQGSNGRSP
jgi:hypothetical protein